jgi:hypothetical protein
MTERKKPQEPEPEPEPKPFGGGARRNIKIVITQELIDTATRRDSGHCMIADAVRRAVPEARYVSVDLQSIRWTDPEAGKRYVYLTPRVAQMGLVDFDQGVEGIEPFRFSLRSVAQITRSKGKASKPGAEVPTKTTVVRRSAPRSVPTRLGGKPPPVGALNSYQRRGRRREFGLRALTR